MKFIQRAANRQPFVLYKMLKTITGGLGEIYYLAITAFVSKLQSKLC